MYVLLTNSTCKCSYCYLNYEVSKYQTNKKQFPHLAVLLLKAYCLLVDGVGEAVGALWEEAVGGAALCGAAGGKSVPVGSGSHN